MPERTGVSAGLGFATKQAADLLDLIFPPVCGLCGLPADSDDRLVCPACWEKIAGLEGPYCSTCRRIMPSSSSCRDCPQPSLPVYSLGFYHGPLQAIIHDLKFAGLKPLAAALGYRLGKFLLDPRFQPEIDLILPVPLHTSRRRRRGFNQSEEIARSMGETLAVPVVTDIIYLTRKTRQQSKLPASSREANVRGAYAIEDYSHVLNGKTVLLVDDVTTTGATLRENQRIVLAASAKRVLAATAATAA